MKPLCILGRHPWRRETSTRVCSACRLRQVTVRVAQNQVRWVHVRGAPLDRLENWRFAVVLAAAVLLIAPVCVWAILHCGHYF